MRLSSTRIFDLQLIAKSQAFEELKPYFEYSQRTTDDLLQFASGNVGFQTNIDCQIFTVALKDHEKTAVNLAKQPIGMIVIKQNPIAYPIESFVWQLNQQGQPEVIVSFTSTDPAAKVDTTILAIFS